MAARRKHRFSPTPVENLESRVVLSRTGLLRTRPSSAGIPTGECPIASNSSRSSPRSTRISACSRTTILRRATYLTSIQGQSNPGVATTAAFSLYTTQRVGLLAQQLLSASVSKRLVGAKIIGSRQQMPPGSLALSLIQTIPQPGTTAPTVSLYSLGQDNSIQAAQVAILNGVKHTK